ncbi:MAG: SiaB family protein kinase [Flavobacteriales bacterium]|nr:SiaB family protein kinase [Flavobacteriales bacterium]
MERFSAWSLFQANQDARLMFAYRGPFREHLTEGIIGISENTLEGEAELSKVNRKVSFLLVECFQNILKHGDSIEKKDIDHEAMFSFRAFPKSFYINSINKVNPDDKDKLAEAVELVNSLDKKELKELYLKQLQDNEISERGGAGLGLIELARKSGQPLRFDFDKDAQGNTLFNNQVNFKKTDDSEELDFMQTSREFKSMMTDKGILMCYKGDFSQGAILPLLNIVEINIEQGIGSQEAKKVGHVLIEMLQNISHHAPVVNGVREGVIVIGQKEQNLYIETGNVMPSSNVNTLESSLSEMMRRDEEGLKELHKQKFKESIYLKDKQSTGLGLLQVAKACRGRISYRFDEYNNEETFFSFRAFA